MISFRSFTKTPEGHFFYCFLNFEIGKERREEAVVRSGDANFLGCKRSEFTALLSV